MKVIAIMSAGVLVVGLIIAGIIGSGPLQASGVMAYDGMQQCVSSQTATIGGDARIAQAEACWRELRFD